MGSYSVGLVWGYFERVNVWALTQQNLCMQLSS
ncbi:hypothetical protein T11_16271 [Trichinella zimbabwensis]|uniref:Uncharacterized protein n=1 Tax=Trichinella zimbabwensis TaxID=268475 RepID=A0A0V1G9E0_9BILA|nr:hypothetical protein T11_16271 [Trichinella zimbabwensis]